MKSSSNAIERHLRMLVDSEFAFVAPKPGSSTQGSIGTASAQRLAIDEANQVLTFLDRQPEPVGVVPSPPRTVRTPPRTPPEDAVMAKTYPHHIRYMGAACRAPPSKAIVHLEQAHEAGSRLAAAELGQMLVLGIGAPRNLRRGLQLLDEACAVGHPGAMLAVGKCLRDATGVPRDTNAALTWIERAAAIRYAPAAHELGEMFETGFDDASSDERGGSGSSGGAAGATADEASADADDEGSAAKDLVEAYRWYKVGAQLDYAPSQLNIAKLFLLGSSLAVSEPGADTSVKARYWLERASANGSLEATALLQRAPKHEDPEPDAVEQRQPTKPRG